MKQTIKKLSPSLVTRIAAGQVVERPISVVKELIENSIDAQATQIDVELEDGGRKRIRVKDNGHGMNKRDLSLSFLSHTTSKISRTSDLHSISTMGFRGEALASIVSVATVILKSKTQKDSLGYTFTVSKDSIKDESRVGMQT